MDQLALLAPKSAPAAPSRQRESRAATQSKDFGKTFESTLKQSEQKRASDKSEAKPEAVSKALADGKQASTAKTEKADSTENTQPVTPEEDAVATEPEAGQGQATDPLAALMIPEALLANVVQTPQQQVAQTPELTAGTVQVSELMQIAPSDLNIREITVIKELPTGTSVESASSFAQVLKGGEKTAAPQLTFQQSLPQPVTQAAVPVTQAAEVVVQASVLATPVGEAVVPQISATPAEGTLSGAKNPDFQMPQGVVSSAEPSAPPLVQAAMRQEASGDSESGLEDAESQLTAAPQSKKLPKPTEHHEVAEAPKAELKAKVEVTQEVKESVPTQIVRQAREVIGKGRTEIRIQLNPETLGSLTLKVSHQDGVVKAHIVAESHQTKELIENQLAGLKAQFAEQGLKVERIEVVAKSPMGFDTAMDQRQSSPQQQQDSQRHTHRQAGVNTASEAMVGGEMPVEEASGSLDVKA